MGWDKLTSAVRRAVQGEAPTAATTAGVTAEDISLAFEVLLRRPPHGKDDIAHHLSLGFKNRFELGDYLCVTDEFRARMDRLAAEGLVPSSRSEHITRRPVTVFLGDRVLTQTHRGFRIYCVPTDVDLTPHLILHGGWETHVEQVIQRLLRPGQQAMDIGANIGYHTLSIAAAVGGSGRVHAFEANPALQNLLYSSIFINGMSSYVQVHPLAVTDRPGSIVLASQPLHFGSGNVVPERAMDDGYHNAYSNRVEVPSISLDTFFPSDAVFDLLRIDIEGAEPLALRGAEALIRRSPRLQILCEWSVGMMSARADVGAFVAWLVELGFRFWLITPSGRLEALDTARMPDLPHSDVVISRHEPENG
ncbi:FkbM family methyltransferase [Siccirubricoccus sp. KC 17139]|uniref:FkbM family methyltransferase n=1 Tax=Siccirubricoccus soli TaxID=2899147 RepID=A0ABT1D831_9PROT|nr:FkbM family methyltransferase [Siccirubricoccus soli]MCO6418066.1 FkbM family methyltransferase [Siccirubricoccus soli]MCP2684201.1 FkbM family methyltransferase [Siccirubricoccus soli]